MKLTQTGKVLEYLKTHDGITQKDAIREFECYRLSARIADLRALGVRIETEIRHSKKSGSNYAFYYLAAKAKK